MPDPNYNYQCELIPTTVLLDEILDRYNDAIFAGIIERKEGDREYRIVSRRHTGDVVSCIALAGLMSENCARLLSDSIEEISPDEI